MDELKFVADGMLGKLSRWLRMLGYDVKYSTRFTDKELTEIAKAEGRILLTRDQELFQRATSQNITAALVEGSSEPKNLAKLATLLHLRLNIDVSVSRCPRCNERIVPALKEEVLDKVPEGTLKHYSEFWKCPNCEHIYWRGSHWKRIRETLDSAKRLVS